ADICSESPDGFTEAELLGSIVPDRPVTPVISLPATKDEEPVGVEDVPDPFETGREEKPESFDTSSREFDFGSNQPRISESAPFQADTEEISPSTGDEIDSYVPEAYQEESRVPVSSGNGVMKKTAAQADPYDELDAYRTFEDDKPKVKVETVVEPGWKEIYHDTFVDITKKMRKQKDLVENMVIHLVNIGADDMEKKEIKTPDLLALALKQTRDIYSEHNQELGAVLKNFEKSLDVLGKAMENMESTLQGEESDVQLGKAMESMKSLMKASAGYSESLTKIISLEALMQKTVYDLQKELGDYITERDLLVRAE
ncbi:MAG: hypothetical protein PHQ23_09180, partial [Candidatus Wallbacteria bacterium]|nr:hypothetical protein [Candidatus Wallbacteria bacterium]